MKKFLAKNICFCCSLGLCDQDTRKKTIVPNKQSVAIHEIMSKSNGNTSHAKQPYVNTAYKSDEKIMFTEEVKTTTSPPRPRQMRQISDISEMFRLPLPDDKSLSELVIEEYDSKSRTLHAAEPGNLSDHRSCSRSSSSSSSSGSSNVARSSSSSSRSEVSSGAESFKRDSSNETCDVQMHVTSSHNQSDPCRETNHNGDVTRHNENHRTETNGTAGQEIIISGSQSKAQEDEEDVFPIRDATRAIKVSSSSTNPSFCHEKQQSTELQVSSFVTTQDVISL